jgi:mannose-1-phosphate guanylyltransferase
LLEETLERALRFTGARERIVVSGSRPHRAELDECLAEWPEVIRVEQPRNLDTTPGVTLPLLHVLVRDPWATVLVLPSDHHVSDDARFVAAFDRAVVDLDERPDTVLLAGARLRTPEPDLGWIVPGTSSGRWRDVVRFEEKPDTDRAAALHASGALANTFAFVARGSALAQLVRRHARDWWRFLNRACFDAQALEEGYAAMRPSSFSRDVLQAGVQSLGVFPLKGVAWSDIGTPDRLAAMRSVAIAGAEALVA